MGEKILVFEGAFVAYRSWLKRILCRSFDFLCFEILDVDPGMVEAGECATVQIFGKGHKAIIGSQLWSDGEKYIVSSRPWWRLV
jgi:hypothetical protein